MSILATTGIILAVVGIGGILMLVIKKIPVLLKLPTEYAPLPEQGLKHELKDSLKQIKYSTYRPLLLSLLEKNLRRFRLLILKIDNVFAEWIKKSRHRSDVWTIRSKAWIEHRRLKKKEKAQILEKLDKLEVSQTIEKIKQEVAKEEDKALKEKIETIAEPIETTEEPQKETEEPNEEEKKYIDLIAENPKNSEAYRELGFVYLKHKNYSDARACFRQVLKLIPDDEPIKTKLEEIKGLRGPKKPPVV